MVPFFTDQRCWQVINTRAAGQPTCHGKCFPRACLAVRHDCSIVPTERTRHNIHGTIREDLRAMAATSCFKTIGKSGAMNLWDPPLAACMSLSSIDRIGTRGANFAAGFLFS
jgi:hypothetical protein